MFDYTCRLRGLIVPGVLVVLCAQATIAAAEAVAWRDALKQPAEWYGSDDARRMADNILLYQRDNGGWDKRIDYGKALTPSSAAEVARKKSSTETTIDNGATTTELTFLARVFHATGHAPYREAFERGLTWLLDAQYPNGGWPQYFPLRDGYYRNITFNDDAMVNVLTLLRNAAQGEPPYAFVEPARRAAAKAAFDRGIQCILDTQVKIDGRRTVWCAQHDPETLAPAQARAYEHPSLSGMESVPIVRLLMSIDHPSPQVIEAVQSAVRWFDEAKIEGVEMVDVQSPERDRVLVEKPGAEPLWARFYEIGTNRPIFSGRDGVIRYSMMDIERERRAGYRWYTERPRKLLREEYPAWQKKWAPQANVLADE